MNAIAKLNEQLQQLWIGLVQALPQIGMAILFLLLTWLIVAGARRGLDMTLKRMRMRRSLIDVFKMLATTGLWIAGVLIACTIVFPSVTPADLLTALGLGSIAIGFAFKDIFENFVAGILILFREPFRLGDHIMCDDLEGRIEDITIRDTYIRRTDGQRVVVPNAMLFKEPVTIRTDRELRRTSIICGIAYGEDVDTARDVIQTAVDEIDDVMSDEGIQVFAHGFNDSSVDFEITWWTGSKPIDIRRSRDKVVTAVKSALDTAGIEIPFPYRTLTFKEPLAFARATKSAADDEA